MGGMRKKVFQAGACVFGEGNPKICVPIVAENRTDIWNRAEEIASLPIDIVEWRADYYEDVFEKAELSAVLKGLKARLGEKALLFTFRTKGEGGNRAIGQGTYDRLNRLAAFQGADLVDVEAYLPGERAEEIKELHKEGCRVIASSHDFQKTPLVEEMTERLRYMEELGADAAKLAVMPLGRQDVLNLLQASIKADEELSIPVITMSMGQQGVVSRICGRFSGSAMTFAAVGDASAPGQISAEQMMRILGVLNGTRETG